MSGPNQVLSVSWRLNALETRVQELERPRSRPTWSLLTGHRPNDTDERVGEIFVRPEVRTRLRDLLFQPELQGVGYSSFIERACEVAEREIALQRQRETAPGEPGGPAIGSCYSQSPASRVACGLPRGHGGAHSWEVER